MTLVLASYLTPDELGRAALVYVANAIVLMLDEGSESSFVVASGESRPGVLSAVFWHECVLGGALAVGLSAVAPLVAKLYGQPELIAYLVALAPGFLICAPRRFYQALFSRRLEFRPLGIARCCSALAFTGLTWGGLAFGYGVWALVAGLVARFSVESAIVTGYGVGVLLPAGPSLSRWRTGYGRTGLVKSAERALFLLGDRADVLLIGHLLGAAALGVYDVFKRLAVGVYQHVVLAAARVAFPELAAAVGGGRRASIYLARLTSVLWVICPVYLFCVAFSQSLVDVLFVAEWGGYAGVFAYLSGAILLRGTAGLLGAALLSRGWAKRELSTSAVAVAAQAAVVYGTASGGVLAVSRALFWLQVALVIPAYLWGVRPSTGIAFTKYVRALAVPLAYSAAAVTIAWAGTYYLWSAGAKAGVGATLCAICAVVAYNHSRNRPRLPQTR